MRTFTMVARHGMSKDVITDYTLISSNYQTVKVSSDELKNMYLQKKIVINNMTLDPKVGWKSTNGAMENYMFINNATNLVEGVAKAVILDRAEQDDKLLGYTVFTQNGTIVNMSVADAVALTNNKLISNGKIRHTEKGDIVSAIGGNYPIRELAKLSDAPKGETSIDLMFFGGALTGDSKVTKYFGAIVSCTSATEMTDLIDQLSKSNATVISALVPVGGQQVRKSLGIKRMGVNSLYGVFEISVFGWLLTNKKASVKNNLGKIPVSVLKYSDDKSGDVDCEAVIQIDKSGKILETTECEVVAANTAVKSYASSLIKTFEKNKVTIQ